MAAHTGRCFRQWRRCAQRKVRQGVPWAYPIRHKVPLALRPFLNGNEDQVRASADQLNNAIMRYANYAGGAARRANPIRRGARGH